MSEVRRVRVRYGCAWQGRTAAHEPHAAVYGIEVSLVSAGGRASETVAVPGVSLAIAPTDPAGTLDAALRAIAKPLAATWGLALSDDPEVPARVARSGEFSFRSRAIYRAVPVAAAAA